MEKGILKAHDIILLIYLILSIMQVEVKIDNSLKNNDISDFTIEASLYDSGNWLSRSDHIDLLSANIAHLELVLSSDPCLGFKGYMLVGKVQAPKLWSAEKVSDFS